MRCVFVSLEIETNYAELDSKSRQIMQIGIRSTTGSTLSLESSALLSRVATEIIPVFVSGNIHQGHENNGWQ